MRNPFFAVWYSMLMGGAEPLLVRPVRAGLLSCARRVADRRAGAGP